MRCAHRFCLAAALIVTGVAASPLAADEALLYDFEDSSALDGWSNLELPEAADKEPAVKLAIVPDHATTGQSSLELTFSGGQFPTATTTQVLGDWLPYQTFKADVTVERPCVVGFTALLEKSERGVGWDALVSRWTKTVFLKSGLNHVEAVIPQPNDYGVSAQRGKVVRFEIFMYRPHDGESIYVDNIRLTKEKIALPVKRTFTLAGTDWQLPGTTSAEAVIELGKNLKDRWTAPTPRSVEQIEAEFQARFVELKKRHPRAVLAVLRDGQPGYDPAQPSQPFAGWKDAYWNSHGPDSNFVDRAGNRGRAASQEVFMRHRSPLMRVDLGSIPTGANILAAQLVIVRAGYTIVDDRDPTKQSTMWVVEPCLRPWEEYEVNAFEYAHDQFWQAIGGMDWGDDPDFGSEFLAYGPGEGRVNAWDFTAAVRYWTDGRHANHGFMLHGDSRDYITAHTREADLLEDRPTVLVIYEPK